MKRMEQRKEEGELRNIIRGREKNRNKSRGDENINLRTM